MDIAIPRDIDPKVKEFDNVFYNDIDSLNVIVNSNIEKRKSQIPAVQNIIMEELISFFSWYNTLEIVPTIKSFRSFFEEIRKDELKKIKYKVSEEDYLKLEDMTRRMIGRILHNPTVKLREIAESGLDSQDAVSHSLMLKGLFDLDNIPQNGDKENNSEQ